MPSKLSAPLYQPACSYVRFAESLMGVRSANTCPLHGCDGLIHATHETARNHVHVGFRTRGSHGSRWVKRAAEPGRAAAASEKPEEHERLVRSGAAAAGASGDLSGRLLCRTSEQCSTVRVASRSRGDGARHRGLDADAGGERVPRHSLRGGLEEACRACWTRRYEKADVTNAEDCIRDRFLPAAPACICVPPR